MNQIWAFEDGSARIRTWNLIDPAALQVWVWPTFLAVSTRDDCDNFVRLFVPNGSRQLSDKHWADSAQPFIILREWTRSSLRSTRPSSTFILFVQYFKKQINESRRRAQKLIPPSRWKYLRDQPQLNTADCVLADCNTLTNLTTLTPPWTYRNHWHFSLETPRLAAQPFVDSPRCSTSSALLPSSLAGPPPATRASPMTHI